MTTANIVYGVFDETEDPDAPQLLGVFSTRELAEDYLADSGYLKVGSAFERREKNLGRLASIFTHTAKIQALVVDGELT